MSALELLLVAAAGAVGALLRDRSTAGRGRDAVAALNIVGSLLLGAATAIAPVADRVSLVVGAGLLGGLTTFSTWAVVAHDGRRPVRWALLTLLLGVGAAAAGRALVRMLA